MKYTIVRRDILQTRYTVIVDNSRLYPRSQLTMNSCWSLSLSKIWLESRLLIAA